MKIEGDTIRGAADQAQGAGRTVEPMLRATNEVAGEVGRRLVHGMPRKARLVEFKAAEYRNAEDWTSAEDGAVTVHASVSRGGTTVDLSEPIEFIHYGKVYRDRSQLLWCPKVDDSAARLTAIRDRDDDGERAPRAGHEPAGRGADRSGGTAPRGTAPRAAAPRGSSAAAPTGGSGRGAADRSGSGRGAADRSGSGRDASAGRGASGRDASGRDASGRGASGRQRERANTIDAAAHGLYFRAGLQREAVLLGGFIRAQMDALAGEEKEKGAIGVLATVIADLTGSGGGSQDKPHPVDLNPHLQKVIKAAKLVNRPRLDYVGLHTCGIELHTARRAYREYLVSEIEKRKAPPKTPEPGGGILNEQVPAINESLAAGHAWLASDDGDQNADGTKKHDAVPKLTHLVPPSVQDFLSLVQKISFKAWDVSATINHEYALRLEPIIEDVCRRMTISSMKKRHVPVFPIWSLEAQAAYELPEDIELRIFDRVENPLQKKDMPKYLGALANPINAALDPHTDSIKKELTAFDRKVGIDTTLDFLSRPDRYTPGRPFLDEIFLIPPDPDAVDVPSAAKRARTGWSSGLGQIAVDSFKSALQIQKMPAFLEFTVSRISTVCAEFIRGVYGKLLVLEPDAVVAESELHEAAKRHLVGNVIESILSGLKFSEKLRNAKLDLPIAEVAISTDALIGRAKEFAALKLERFIDPVIKFAMRDLHGMIFAHRKAALANRALTMEVHLAQLPVVFSRLFRNVFFPLWDKALERTIEAVSASLMPRLVDAGHAILKAREQSEQVRGKIAQGLAALDTLPGKLPDAGFSFRDPKGSVKKLKEDWNPIVKNAKDAWNEAEVDVTQDIQGDDYEAVEDGFPVQKRVPQVEVLPVTPEHLKKVRPQLQWRGDEEEVQDEEIEGEHLPGVAGSSASNQRPGRDGGRDRPERPGRDPRPGRSDPPSRPGRPDRPDRPRGDRLDRLRGIQADRPGGQGTQATAYTPPAAGPQSWDPSRLQRPSFDVDALRPAAQLQENSAPAPTPSPLAVPPPPPPALRPATQSLVNEKTQELGPLSDDLRELANLDPEQTVDVGSIPSASEVAALPFRGLKKP